MQLYTPPDWSVTSPGNLDTWPLVIRMLVYESHELKPNDILICVNHACNPSDDLNDLPVLGTRVGARWSRFIGPVSPAEARVPDKAIPWITLWEAAYDGDYSGLFTTLQYRSLVQALRELESEENDRDDGERLLREQSQASGSPR